MVKSSGMAKKKTLTTTEEATEKAGTEVRAEPETAKPCGHNSLAQTDKGAVCLLCGAGFDYGHLRHDTPRVG